MKLLFLLTSFIAAGYAQSGDCSSLEACRKTLEANPKSSLAHYRIGELLFRDRQWDAARNELWGATRGDLNPRWTEASAHLYLGKIYDTTNQRERAIDEYRMVLRIKDNSRGAMEEAKKFLESPYRREEK
jgi:uncharacterized protein HemY